MAARPLLRSDFHGWASDPGFFGFVGPVFGFLPLPPVAGASRAILGPIFVTADDLLHVFHNLRC